MKVLWTRRARRDLEGISDYIARDDPHAAERWCNRLIDRAEGIAATPNAGRRVPGIGRSDIREVFLKAYRIVYRIAGDELLILTVFEGHRRLPAETIPANDD